MFLEDEMVFQRYAAPLALAAAAMVTVLAAPAVMAQQAQADGEVRRVDLAKGKITIKQAAIPALELPAMTLVYLAEPPSLLQGVQAGDKVHFTAVRKDGKYLLTAISKP